MAVEDSTEATWLAVIGKSLAFLCLSRVEDKNPSRVDTVMKKVKFLEGLGVPRAEAAGAAGSTADSVRVLANKSKRGKARGKAKKKR